jgi:hypothetical protein
MDSSVSRSPWRVALVLLLVAGCSSSAETPDAQAPADATATPDVATATDVPIATDARFATDVVTTDVPALDTATTTDVPAVDAAVDGGAPDVPPPPPAQALFGRGVQFELRGGASNSVVGGACRGGACPSRGAVHLGTHLRERLEYETNSRDVAPFPDPSPASGEGWRTPGGAMVHAKERREVRHETVCNPSVSRRLDHS